MSACEFVFVCVCACACLRAYVLCVYVGLRVCLQIFCDKSCVSTSAQCASVCVHVLSTRGGIDILCLQSQWVRNRRLS